MLRVLVVSTFLAIGTELYAAYFTVENRAEDSRIR